MYVECRDFERRIKEYLDDEFAWIGGDAAYGRKQVERESMSRLDTHLERRWFSR